MSGPLIAAPSTHTVSMLPLRNPEVPVPVLATWSPVDAVLGTLVPLGLGVAAGTAVVVDLDRSGPPMGGGPTLADLVERGPTRAELEPRTGSVAYLRNGGIDAPDAAEVIGALVDRWPAVVLRCSGRHARPSGSVAIAPLLPEAHAVQFDPPILYQRCGFSPHARPDGHVLPAPRRRTVELLLSGRSPSRRDRWIRSLSTLWGSGG